MMKTMKMAVLMVMVTASQGMHARQQDTLVVERPQQVMILQTEDTLDIRVSGKEGNPDFRLEKKARLATEAELVTTSAESRHSALGWDFGSIEGRAGKGVLSIGLTPRIEGGFLLPLNKPDGMSTSLWKSTEAHASLISMRYDSPMGKWWLDLSYGFNMKCFVMGNNNRFTADREGNVNISPYPAGISGGDSRLFLFAGALSLNLNYRIGKSSSLGFGVEWLMRGDNWNYCRSRFTDVDGLETKQLYDAKVRNHNLSLKLNWEFARNCNLYVRFAPWSPFKSAQGPQFSTLSFGIGFGF